MIRVLKRNGSSESFDSSKLTAALWRAVKPCGESHQRASALADAVLFYLARNESPCVSSAAIFEMCLKTLGHVNLSHAARLMQFHRFWRQSRRKNLRIRHDDQKLTLWDKGWLADVAQTSWNLSPTTCRILAADVEMQLLEDGRDELGRHYVIELMNDRVAAYGLADAVPVR